MPFVDVPDGFWGRDYIATAWSQGLMDGIDATHFAPYDRITREQAVSIVCKAFPPGQPGE